MISIGIIGSGLAIVGQFIPVRKWYGKRYWCVRNPCRLIWQVITTKDNRGQPSGFFTLRQVEPMMGMTKPADITIAEDRLTYQPHELTSPDLLGAYNSVLNPPPAPSGLVGPDGVTPAEEAKDHRLVFPGAK
jgi:hypothetical protein